jgi:hypothetical protein
MYQNDQDQQYQSDSTVKEHLPPSSGIDIVSVGSLNKIVVDGKELLVVGPQAVREINQAQAQMQRALAELAAKYQRLQTAHTRLLSQIAKIERELESKISYD